MTEEEKAIEQTAIEWVNRPETRQYILKTYAALKDFPAVKHPEVIFLAGSPGAGKTESIKGLHAGILNATGIDSINIDPDALRKLLPGYTGSNAYIFQHPVAIMVDIIYYSALENKQSVIIDGTLANHKFATKNIDLARQHSDHVSICYVYQDPAIAWRFTQIREAVEGRNIRKADFITKFLAPKETVNKLKSDYGSTITVHVIHKNYRSLNEALKQALVYTNIDTIESCIPFDFTKKQLEGSLPDEITV